MMLISVLIAVYNEEKYIESCIDSLISADREGFDVEIICVDDKSTDETVKKLNSYTVKYPAIVKAFAVSEKGKATAFSEAFEKSSGDIIALVGGDDIVSSNYFSSRVELVKNLSKEKPAVFMGKMRTFSETAKFDGHVIPRSWKNNRNFSGGLMFFNRSAANIAFPVPSTLPSEDGWLGLHARMLFDKYYVDDVVLNYRIHDGNSVSRESSFSDASERISKRRIADIMFFNKMKSRIDLVMLCELKADIELEKRRSSGRWFALFFTEASLVAKLRAFSHANSFIYKIRITFFGFLSGR